MCKRAALLSILLLALPSLAFAAEWPGNYLGPADNGYRELKIGVFYYGAVLHDFADEGATLPFDAATELARLALRPEQGQMARTAEFERIRGELMRGADFYWRNSRFNCACDFEWIVEDSPVLRSSIAAADAPYWSPVDHSAYSGMREKYDGLLQVMVLYEWDSEAGALRRVRGGGGFTWGADDAARQCGWSWWAAPPDTHSCGSDWLFVHEFGHQLDSLFEQSGHPEFWFNHLAPSEGNTARFGEHFDANAYILRRVPEADWQDLRWGTWRGFVDADGDGVQDSDDWLASRFNCDPDATTGDADGDGLSDCAEMLATNGISIGHGERLHQALKTCDPWDSDTDDDGLADGQDPYPMLPNLSQIAQLQGPGADRAGSAMLIKSIDGLYAGEVPLFDVALLYQPDSALDITFSMFSDWQDSPVVEDYKIMLDLDNDGWFSGSDNYMILLRPDHGVEISRHNADSAIEWPQTEVLGSDVEARLSVWSSTVSSGDPAIGDLFVIGLTLLKSDFPELAAKPGEEIGFNAGMRLLGESWHHMLGEPNTLVPLELR